METRRMSRRTLLKVMGMGVLGATLASACAPATAPGAPGAAVPAADAGKVTLTWWRWGGHEQSQVHDAALRRVYPELDDQVEINYVIPGAGDFGVAEALRLALAAGQDIPDLVRLNRTQMAEFALAGELTVLDDAYAAYEDDMYTGVLNMTRLDDHYYAFPRQLKSKMFFYRADILDQIGINVDDIVTVADFIEVGREVNGANAQHHLINFGPSPAQYYMGMVLSAYDDARMADPDGTYMVTSLPAFSDMFGMWKQVYDSGMALPIDDFSSDWQQAFADEAIIGSLLANWQKRFIPGFAPEQSGLWKSALWPRFEPLADQRYGSEAGGAIMVIPRRSANVERAIDYATKLTLDKAGAYAVFEAEGETPLMKSAQADVLAYVQNLQKPEGVSDEAFNLHPANFFGPEIMEVEFASYDTMKIFPYDPSASLQIGILKSWLDQHLVGAVDLQTALANAQADMESQIGNPYLL